MVDWLTQKDLAGRLGLSTRQIHNLVAEGLPTRSRSGRVDYPWPAALQWYIDYRVRAAMPANAEEARARKIAAEAALAELELEKARGLVVNVSEARQEVEAALDRLRSRLVSLPGKWGPLMVGCRNVSDATQRLEGAVNEAIVDLSGIADEVEEAA